MRAIVMLFKHAGTVDSEEYIIPKIKKVEISIDGDPNAVYSKGMKTNDLYREARRVFGVKDTDMMEEKFYDDKFALVIDLRNNADNSAMGSGCKVVDTKTGVQLAITNEVTTKDIKCEIFILSDAAVSTVERSFGGIFNAFAFAGAGYLFKMINNDGYGEEIKRHNLAMEQLTRARQEWNQKEIERRAKLIELRQKLLVFEGKKFTREPHICDFYKQPIRRDERVHDVSYWNDGIGWWMDGWKNYLPITMSDPASATQVKKIYITS